MNRLKPVIPALAAGPVLFQQKQSQPLAPFHHPPIPSFQGFLPHGFFIKPLFKPSYSVWCMESDMPSDEDIFKTLRDLYQAIPDASLVTVRMLRERTSEKCGLGPNGLDDKKDMIKAFMGVYLFFHNTSLYFLVPLQS